MTVQSELRVIGSLGELALTNVPDKSIMSEGTCLLPRKVTPKAPPIKTQGIKTKVVPLIASSIMWSGDGRWIEPFFGSGVVALNILPNRAILADINEHLINLYRSIQEGTITGRTVRAHLQREGATLFEKGESHYYALRDRFNEEGDPLDFIFLSRSCFNGMMRFNKRLIAHHRKHSCNLWSSLRSYTVSFHDSSNCE